MRAFFYCSLLGLVVTCWGNNMPYTPMYIPVGVDDIAEYYEQPSSRADSMIGEIQYVDIPRNYNAPIEVVDSAERDRLVDFPYAQRFN
jgi:hypothetical protein